jgi:hypothetical protein
MINIIIIVYCGKKFSFGQTTGGGPTCWELSWEWTTCHRKNQHVTEWLYIGLRRNDRSNGKWTWVLEVGMWGDCMSGPLETIGLYPSNIKVLAGWWSFVVKGFWALWNDIYECVYCYNRYHGNAVTVLWASWVNMYLWLCVFTTLHFSVFVGG